MNLFPMRPQRVPYGSYQYDKLLAARGKPIACHGCWAIEPTLDGMRVLAIVDPNGVALRSRHGNVVNNGEVADAVGKLRINWSNIRGGDKRTGSFVFDGEIYQGRYHIFDVPAVIGDYAYRRAWMEKNVFRFGGAVTRGMQLTCDDPWRWVMERGYEGLVFKYLHSTYAWQYSPDSPPSSQWCKVKP